MRQSQYSLYCSSKASVASRCSLLLFRRHIYSFFRFVLDTLRPNLLASTLRGHFRIQRTLSLYLSHTLYLSLFFSCTSSLRRSCEQCYKQEMTWWLWKSLAPMSPSADVYARSLCLGSFWLCVARSRKSIIVRGCPDRPFYIVGEGGFQAVGPRVGLCVRVC